jgi:hypothetical protein
MQADRQARKADALARVSAGEAGVTGASVDALVNDISAEASAFKVAQEQNLDMTITQLQREKVSEQAQARNRINSVPAANPFATGLTIAGMGLDFAAGQISRRPPSSGNKGS